MAKVLFVAVGADNVSVEVLSQELKIAGHSTDLLFERALFDDKMYYTVPWLASLLSTERELLRRAVEFKPDVIAFTVLVDTYHWCLNFAADLKSILDVPIVFGGIQAMTSGDICLQNKQVDAVCVGEAHDCLIALADNLDAGKGFEDVKNFWFKTAKGEVIKNPYSPVLEELDTLPYPDKEIIKDKWNIRDYYLTVTNFGCIEKCTFCQQNFYAQHQEDNNLGKFFREKSPSAVLEELQIAKKRYGIRYVDIKNNVLTASKKWYREFLGRYPEEVGVPFRIMVHPRQMTEEYCRLLKAAGCDHCQMGVESLNEDVKLRIINRHDSNDHVYSAIDNMEKAGLRYSLDFIFGLPGQELDELEQGARILSRVKNCIRASVFWCQYLPGVGLTSYAFNQGLLTAADVDDVLAGNQDHYMSYGHVEDEKRKKILNNYMVLYRLAPILNNRVMSFILDKGLQRYFSFLPQTPIIIFVDVLVSFIRKDYWAIYAIKSVFWEIWRRVDKNFFLRINSPPVQDPNLTESSLVFDRSRADSRTTKMYSESRLIEVANVG
jgi:hypothetical protein